MVKQWVKNALHFDLDVYLEGFWLVERWFTNAMNLDLGVHFGELGMVKPSVGCSNDGLRMQ